jgi:hypothetical protein
LLKNLTTGTAKVVMEGLDIRKGPIEYDIRLAGAGTCQLGLSYALEVDDYKVFSLRKFPGWTHIQIEMQAGKAAITVDRQKAAFQYGKEGISYFQPFIMVMARPAVEVSHVRQTQPEQ